MHRLRFLTRPGCHLCDAARFVVERVASETDAIVEYVDVSHDQALEVRYGWHVPVLFVDGVEHARHRVDEAALRRALGANTLFGPAGDADGRHRQA